MKLDYELLRHILERIESDSDGQERHVITRETFSEVPRNCDSFEILAYHFDILCENHFVEGEVCRIGMRGHRVVTSIDYFGLTLLGHQLLESMRTDALWSRIKSTATDLGIEGLKQIPSLAVTLLLGSTG